ncbi:hypothetical protein C7972_1211 [Arenibacter sp. ARW7G5Y1]|nr:hypothetical protein C7972_1211 [Arenibacter sp. ARW7G5Y1]
MALCKVVVQSSCAKSPDFGLSHFTKSPDLGLSVWRSDTGINHASGVPTTDPVQKKSTCHIHGKCFQKKAAAYSMTARYCKRSEAGTDAGTNHAQGVPFY